MMHCLYKILYLTFFTLCTMGSLAQVDSSVHNLDYGIVNLSVANLRTKPSHTAEMATQLLMGTQIDILQKHGGNYRVRTPEGYIAWIPASSIVPMHKAEIKKWNKKNKIIYTTEFGKSFSRPHTSSQRVSDLVYGNILSLQDEDQSFYEVAYPDNRIAYIPKEEAMLLTAWMTTRSATAEQILTSAKSMLGLPYLWGGTSVKGVDCSGFTKMSFFMNGYIIPRDASQQVLAGDRIEILDDKKNFSSEKALRNLQPADLLFFAADKNNKSNARVTHVAIYIGKGEFIHAAGTVKINSLLKDAVNYDAVQARTIVAARRYIDANDVAIQKIDENPYYNKN
ncbi:C40 family peptidase [Sphingobacterium arenae]|uniref:C40 family peptidase n=2 Tax=Sphingobacterium arenae TaxID=1280598 RepID=A0ABR7Y2E3_9SPHI|nr:C40 family peptidase [Sphingobacterium arenae]MBD1425446.1 C40 family peptidase [Sphingobacterium arenae]